MLNCTLRTEARHAELESL